MKGVRVVHQLSVPGEDESRQDVPPFSEEVDTRLVHNTYGWDGYIREPDLKQVGICCSGGGIRSAAYGLGALQVLRTSGYLADADYLAAVSGGDYISVAHTVLVSETLKAHTAPDGDPAQTEREYFGAMVPWALSSPEEEHLRNRSSYIAPGLVGKVWFALNLLYGMIRHLLPFAAIILLTSFGFALAFGHALCGKLNRPTPQCDGTHVVYPAVLWALAVLAVLVGIGLVIRQVVQSHAEPDGTQLARLQRLVMRVFWLQVAVAVFGIGLPALLVWIHHRPFGGLFNSGLKAAGFEGGSITITSLAAFLAKRGTADKRTSLRFLVPFVTTLLGPLIIGVPFVALTFWMTQREAHLKGPPLALAAASAVLLLVFWFIDESTANIHLFYRERLSSVFVGLRSKEPDGDREYLVFREPPWKQPVWFSQILKGTSSAKLPNLVVCAAVNVSQDVPPGRLAASFTFEQDYSGGPLTGYLPTSELEALAGRSVLTLPAMMAISGAAVSPSMGKMTRPWLRLLLAMFNARLGVWLPNPWRHDPLRPHDLHHPDGPAHAPQAAMAGVRRQLKGPGTLYAIREALGLNDARTPFIYVTDGGHWENLGLVELLRRGCGQVLCFDAAGDDLGHFSTLSQAIALARSELGVRIEIDLQDLMPNDQRVSASDVVRGCIRYPDGTLGVLVFAKLAMPVDAPQDAKAYRDRDPKFPTNPTSDQLFNDQKFESYHALGRHAGMNAVREMNAWRREHAEVTSLTTPPATPSASAPSTAPPTTKSDLCAPIETMVPNPYPKP